MNVNSEIDLQCLKQFFFFPKTTIFYIIFVINIPSLDHTSLHIPILEIQDQEAPASEVLPVVEEQLEQDVLQHQDVHSSVSLTEEDKVEELDKGQFTVIIHFSLSQWIDVLGVITTDL